MDAPLNKEASALDELLYTASPDFKSKILEVINRAGYDANDPLFVLLVANAQLELMLHQSPKAFEKIFNNWLVEMRQVHELAERELLNRQKAAISESTAQLLKSHLSNSVNPSNINWTNLLSKSFLVLALVFNLGMTCGYFLGASVELSSNNQLKNEVSRNKTQTSSKETKNKLQQK
jgi:hypothetical protein